jgi:glycosyltransferase involved in cell wall biosynthesis
VTIRRICIVGLDTYPLLSGEPQMGLVAGEYVQRVLLARAWRDLGLEVSMIVHDQGQGARQEVDGITALAAYPPDEGIPILRFVHPRATRLLSALAAADADIYYQSCAGVHTGITSWFCRSVGKRFVYRIASDVDCMPGKQLIEFWRDRKLFEYGLRRADLVAAQTTRQVNLLLENYGVASSVVNMVVETPPAVTAVAKEIDVLWVSNLQRVKRPEIVLELARALPQVKFCLAGGPMPGRQTYYHDMLHAASRLPNVTMLGPVRYADIGHVFDRARLFVNTSSVEGFPNTFLQAWIRGIPVVSFFDPDGLLQKRTLGWAANSLEDMRVAIRTLLENDLRRETIAQEARSLAHREFSPPAVAARYLELLEVQQQPRLRFGSAG